MLEANFQDDDKRMKAVKRLLALLNKQKYKPLWREIYNRIAESQAEYPLKLECVGAETLSLVRKKIQTTMKACGYTGQYPDFVKQGEMKKIHLAESYGRSYFVGKEKNVQYYIKCLEIGYDDSYEINFICGTAILKNGESTEDIFDCLFDANGKRISKKVVCHIEHLNQNKNEISAKLEQAVRVAVKRAEFQTLTKEERRLYGTVTSFSYALLMFAIWLFIVLHVLFFTYKI